VAEVSPALAQDFVQATRVRIDAVGAGRLRWWAGPKATWGSAPTGTLVAIHELALPCGVATAGVLTLTLPPAVVAMASFLPTWCEVIDGSGERVLTLDARAAEAPDDGQEAVFSAETIVGGMTLSVLSVVISAMPAS